MIPADNHLTDDQIIRYLVDTGDLSSEFRFHLESCSRCQAEKNHLESNLCRLGEIAGNLTPEMRRRIIISHDKRKKTTGWNWFKLATAGTTFAVGVLLTVWLGLSHMERRNTAARLTTEMIKDEHLMTEIEKIDRNDLPQTWMDIIGDSEVNLDGSLIRVLTPKS